jgi:hypothetical protein
MGEFSRRDVHGGGQEQRAGLGMEDAGVRFGGWVGVLAAGGVPMVTDGRAVRIANKMAPTITRTATER